MRFSEEWRLQLEAIPLLDFYQEMVLGLIVEGEKVVGVRTALGIEIRAKAVVLTNGTFLNGLIHIGDKNFGGGRAGERASTGITGQLVDLGFEAGRMKTGTPPRVDGRSLDYSVMEPQPGDAITSKFSYSNLTSSLKQQRDCHMTYTSPEVHNILKEGFDRSPMFNGRIKSVGPRYCPSIEDKIERFADKDRHQIFVEPEGWNTCEVYVNGFSTSLPEDIQFKALRSVAGFEKVKFFRPGYAIEYDYFPPTQLKHTLETKLVSNLYFAGQINGTTGYEEAASQGLMAGINAVRKIRDEEAFILRRDEAYIGVLVDDLITKGTDEPYRMFTSRAEYRTLLRQDNADLRLTPRAVELGIVTDEALKRVDHKKRESEKMVQFLRDTSYEFNEMNTLLVAKGSKVVTQNDKLFKVFSRPQIDLEAIKTISQVKVYLEENDLNDDILEQVEVHVKYEGYIAKEKDNADKLNRLENVKIPAHYDFKSIKSLSYEAVEKLTKIQPVTVSQASRISGVSPSDISVLLVHMGR
ncbi:MAG: tRNA uridine 5-carboxymethylaminomethyl modification enzyme [Nonlabens sp.]|jgi:tRNA uridine 5-carboxymethylaminomethyl modification enzyme